MSTRVKLSEIVSAMDVPNEDWTVYLNRHTGETVTVTPEDVQLLEHLSDLEDAPAWQLEQLPAIREALQSEDYLALPDKFEIHEWSIMLRFARGMANDEHREALDRALHGGGAFRAFRVVLDEVGLLEDWYRFRDRAFEDIGEAWLRTHGIPFDRTQDRPFGDGV